MTDKEQNAFHRCFARATSRTVGFDAGFARFRRARAKLAPSRTWAVRSLWCFAGEPFAQLPALGFCNGAAVWHVCVDRIGAGGR